MSDPRLGGLRNLLVKIGLNFLANKKKLADLSGPQFVNLLYRLFNAMDHSVQSVGRTSDQGGDLIINKSQQRVVALAKSYTTTAMGISAIQEAVTAQKYYGYSQAMIVTCSDFTKEATELAKVNNVELIGAKQLKDWLLKYLKESWS